MAAQQPTPQSARIPPDLPSDPSISGALGVYLRNFALWCRDGFAEQMRNNQALRGVMLMGYDAPAGTNPPVWMLECNATGRLGLAPMALGSKAEPGAFAPIGEGYYQPAGYYLPTDSAGYVPGQVAIRSTDNAYAYVAFHDVAATRRGWMGWSVGNAGLVINNDVSNGSLLVSDDGVNYFTGGVHFPVTAGWIANPDPNATAWSPRVQSVGSNDAYINFLVPSNVGVNFGLNANGHFYIGGWSIGGNYFNVWTAADFANPACDYRFKDAIKPLDSTWDQVKALKPIRYRQKEHHAKSGGFPLIEKDDRERWGFLAHELQETLGPTAATGVKDIEDRLQAPNMNMVVAALVRTVQEMQARIEELEAR